MGGGAYLSPVRSERSKRRSEDACTRRMSAGTRSPMESTTRSPTTTSREGIVWCLLSRMTVASSAISVLMELMIREACQSTSA